jgi:23S rRNA pseudouridine1911/1915/1917 synthase
MRNNLDQLVFEELDSKRLDVFLSESNPNISRSFIAKQIVNGEIKVNSKIAKASLKLHSGDNIKLDKQVLNFKKPKSVKLPVIYEDNYCLIINKPSGLLTHAKGTLNNETSIASFIYPKLSDEMEGNKAGIVHRLDRGTSGIIIAAKTPFALKYFQRQFAKRQVTKVYVAIVSGKMDKQQAIINMPIERNPKYPSIFRVGPKGKIAETSYQVISTNQDYSLLMLTPKTGRTHQLRVHLKAINHPIVGDNFYGGLEYGRLMLHAYTLELIIPDVGRTSFSAPIPKEFAKLISIPSTI